MGVYPSFFVFMIMKQSEMLFEIKESIKTINHNSSRTADAIEGINKTNAKLDERTSNIINILLKITIPLIAGILALVGIRMAMGGGA